MSKKTWRDLLVEKFNRLTAISIPKGIDRTSVSWWGKDTAKRITSRLFILKETAKQYQKSLEEQGFETKIEKVFVGCDAPYNDVFYYQVIGEKIK